MIRYGVISAVMAILAVLLGTRISWWPARIALGCLAASLLLVGAAYLGAGPRLLMKSPRGSLYPASWILLWPFRLLNALVFNVYHRLSGEPAYVEVVPGLYLGRRLWGKEAEALDVAGVLDLTCEVSENRPMRALEGYCCLPVLDNGCPTPGQLREGAVWLAENLQRGPVYVHCAAGHGRSATLVLAYLLAVGQVQTIEEGIAFLKARRPRVHINRCQRAALSAFMALRSKA